MEIAQLIIPVVSSAVGLAVSLLLVVLLRKQAERDAGTKIGILLGLAVSVIYVAVCGTSLCKYYGIAEGDWPAHLSTLPLMLIAPFLPFLILWSWRVSPILQWKTRFSRGLVAFACVSGFGIAAMHLWVGIDDPSINLRFSQIFALNGLICFLPAIPGIVRLPLNPRLHLFIRVTCSIYIFGVIEGALTDFVNPAWEGMTSLSSDLLVLLRLLSILIGFLGSFIVAARFRYVDVFVRWSTRITILGVLSILGTLSFALVTFDVKPSSRGAGFLACAFEMIVLLLLGIIVSEKCERWVESHVLQRTDLKAEGARLHARLFTLESKEDLFAFLEDELTHALDVREVTVLPRTTIPQEVLAVQNFTDESFEIPSRIAPLTIGALRDVEVLVPIPSNGKIEELIGVSTGVGRRSLHSGEIRFLHDVGRQLGVRLHHLEVEAASRRQALREALLRQQLTEAELRALRAQLNPHFLFNSLNTIADLIVRNPVNAERMTMRLSSVFRHVLAQTDREFVTLAEEFSFLRNYLDIEKERFGENLQVSFELEPSVAHVSIPTLLLQPLVENAMKHGLAPKGGKRSLRIAAAGSVDGVLLEVIDNGIGFPQGSVQPFSSASRTSGVGLANTRARLRAVYGDEGGLVIESVPMQGSRVSFSLPMKEVIA